MSDNDNDNGHNFALYAHAALCSLFDRMKQRKKKEKWISLPVVFVAVCICLLVCSSNLLNGQQQIIRIMLDSSNHHLERQNTNSITSPRVLIAQYSSGQGDPYDRLLNMTQPTNERYAARWGYDYFALRGPPDGLAEVMRRANVTVSGSRATYFKVLILDSRIRQGVYDVLVLMDADAILYDFDRDIVELIPPDKLLVAHKVCRNDSDSTSMINIGVTVWNLRHPLANEVARQWKEKCLERITSGRLDDDQKPLQDLFKYGMTDQQREQSILALSDEFAYGHGTFIKHFIRRDHNDWDVNKSLERRIRNIEQASLDVCHRYSIQC